MTTPAAAAFYLEQHQKEYYGRPFAVYNPKELPVEELTVIYGFNNGGSPGWFSALALAENGVAVGGHLCSDEGYMPSDLGMLEGSRPDRHETYRKYYPNGYRCEFVPREKIDGHEALKAVFNKDPVWPWKGNEMPAEVALNDEAKEA